MTGGLGVALFDMMMKFEVGKGLRGGAGIVGAMDFTVRLIGEVA